MKNITVTGNSAGIYLTSGSSPTLDSITINSNQGIGLYCKWSCDATVTNTTITYNQGAGIICSSSDPNLFDITISGNTGGGIRLSDASNPMLKTVKIVNNSSNKGGGMRCYSNCYPTLENVTIANNSASSEGGGIQCEFGAKPVFNPDNRCNIYNNFAAVGADYYAEVQQYVVVDTFTVMYPSSYQAYPRHLFNFDILNAKTELIDADLYVSPDGDNSNSGLTQEEPLKNIDYAFSRIMALPNHYHTIHLMEGIYSTSSNGELFPVYLLDYCDLTGVSEDGVVLDAEGQSIVMIVKNNLLNQMSNFTVTNGKSDGSYPYHYCGGITLDNSNVKLSDITIKENADGGISSLGGSHLLENVKIINNGDVWGGGGLYVSGSSPVLINVLISGNQADECGGGVYCNYHGNPVFRNVTITENSAAIGSGVYCSWSSNPQLVNTILWNNLPGEICFNDGSQPNSITIAWSDIRGGEAGIVTNGNGTVNWLEGNIDLDPQFTGAGDHPFELQDESPCVNSGTPDTTGLILPALDLAGNPRFYGGRIDMGAYENQNMVIGIEEFKVHDFGFEVKCLPNPFRNSITIFCTLPYSGFTNLSIHNITGKKILTLHTGLIQAGEHSFVWDAEGMPEGMYLLRLETEEVSASRKLLLLE
jgi:parallel beta-helix repeat protein